MEMCQEWELCGGCGPKKGTRNPRTSHDGRTRGEETRLRSKVQRRSTTNVDMFNGYFCTLLSSQTHRDPGVVLPLGFAPCGRST